MSSVVAPEEPLLSESRSPQYSLGKIIGLWLATAIPMAVLGWVVFPLIAPDFGDDPVGRAAVRMGVLTVGMAWLFVLSLIVVRREEGDLRWMTLRRRLRLNAPRDPKTGVPRGRLWLWVIPFFALMIGLGLIDQLMPWSAPAGYDLGDFLASSEAQADLVGAWWILGVMAVMGVFNFVLGEEFFFRGVLLPKCNGVFGRWDWVAAGVLAGLYHVHMPWAFVGAAILAHTFALTLPAKWLRSTTAAMAIHTCSFLIWVPMFIGYIRG